jgi:PAS domain S-box-containing protein
MHFEVRTLAVVSSVLFLVQFVAILVQYRVSRNCPGMGLWLLGSALMAMGGTLVPLVAVRSTQALAPAFMPLFVLGYVFIYLGLAAFTQVAVKRVRVACLYGIYVAIYGFCLVVVDDPWGRALALSGIMAIVSLLIVRCLAVGAWRQIGVSAHFTTGIFLLYGGFSLFRFGRALVAPVITAAGFMAPLYALGYLVPVVTSTLWTFGFILMVNQRLQKDLQEEKETLRKVFNIGPDAASITRMEDGVIIDVNLGFLQMSGYAREEVVGRAVNSFGIWQSQADRALFLNSLRETGTCNNLECRLQRKDGTELFGTISANLVTINGAAHIVSVARDITDYRKAAVARVRQEAENQQIQKAESLGRMAGAIAHHFNNQLQGVLGNLELMREAPPGTDPAHLLAGAREAAERAAKVSRLMLGYIGQTPLEREPLSLAELCRGQVAALKATLPPTVTLETDLTATGAVLKGDPHQLQELVAYLLTNAREALGEAGGRVRLGLRTCPASGLPRTGLYPIHWEPGAGDYVCLEVGDTGCGIAETDQEKIFDPFFSTKFTGRGLGLSVALGTARAHGGAIAVTSAPGRGSVFQVLLPAYAGEVPPRTVPERTCVPKEGGGTVLLVDDDEFVRMTTGALLQMMGFGVVTARDGVEALELFHEHRAQVRCVITDLSMPRMDGWAILKELRQLEPALPVILASGYDQGHVRSGLETDQPHAFLQKPFGLEDLRQALGQAL